MRDRGFVGGQCCAVGFPPRVPEGLCPLLLHRRVPASSPTPRAAHGKCGWKAAALRRAVRGGFVSGPPPRGHRRAAEQLCCERGSVGEGVRVHGSPRAAPPYSHPRCFLRGAGTDPAPRGSDPRPETSGPTLVQTFYLSSRVRPALCSRCGARFVSCTHLRVWEGGNCWRGRCTPGTLQMRGGSGQHRLHQHRAELPESNTKKCTPTTDTRPPPAPHP